MTAAGGTDVGSRLRAARERRGLSVADVAHTTKISIAALKAIERNDFGRLPGGVFRRAYVRSFAAEVGLDGDELVRDYRARVEAEPAVEPVAPAFPDAERLKIGRRLLITVAATGLGAAIRRLFRPK